MTPIAPDGTPPVIRRVLDTALRGDLDEMRRLIDWPLSGAAALVADLLAAPEPGRAGLASAEIWSLYGQAHRTLAVDPALRRRIPVLAATAGITEADAAARDQALAASQLPDPIPGLAGEPAERLRRFLLLSGQEQVAAGQGERQQGGGGRL